MILLILIIIICVFVLFYKKKDDEYEGMELDNEDDDIVVNTNDIPRKIKKEEHAKNNDGEFFVREQFHEDYRDTMNSFNILTGKEVVFDGTVGDFAKTFITLINNSVNDDAIGWQSVLPEQHIESGWDKQMTNLGLPVSLYKEGLKRRPIRIIKLGGVEQSDDKYVLNMIIKKKGVKDKLVIKIYIKYISKTKVVITNVFIDGFLTKIIQ